MPAVARTGALLRRREEDREGGEETDEEGGDAGAQAEEFPAEQARGEEILREVLLVELAGIEHGVEPLGVCLHAAGRRDVAPKKHALDSCAFLLLTPTP